VMTSSPGPKPRARKAMMRASVPLLTPTACRTPRQSATSASTAATSGPPTYWPLRITRSNAATSASHSSSTSGVRSSIGTRVRADVAEVKGISGISPKSNALSTGADRWSSAWRPAHRSCPRRPPADAWPRSRARSARDALVQQAQQVAAVGVGRAELARQRLELLGADPALAVGHLLGAGDLRALAGLERLDENRGLQQALVRAGVEPRHAASEELDAQASLLEVDAVEVGDLELPARRGPQAPRVLGGVGRVEVEPGDGVVALRLARLLLDVGDPARV